MDYLHTVPLQPAGERVLGSIPHARIRTPATPSGSAASPHARQAIYVIYQGIAILTTVALVSGLSTCARFAAAYEATARWLRGGSIRRRYGLRRRMHRASTYDEYRRLALELDSLDGKDEWRLAPSTVYNQGGVDATAQQLREAREAGDPEGLARLLRAVMQRNHLNMDAAELHSECRVGTKASIEELVRQEVTAMKRYCNVIVTVSSRLFDGSVRRVRQWGKRGGAGTRRVCDRVVALEVIRYSNDCV